MVLRSLFFNKIFHCLRNRFVHKECLLFLLVLPLLETSTKDYFTKYYSGVGYNVCIREPRDVCWSLVWRDGPSVGMNWSRAQRLWMRHYRDLLKNLKNVPALVVSYENWFNPHTCNTQVESLANFVGKSCTKKQQESALALVQPEFNHGGVNRLPKVDRAVRRAHSRLLKPGMIAEGEARQLGRDSAALEINQLLQALRERIHLLWIQTPWGRNRLYLTCPLAFWTIFG